jgi:hypothetical protein
MLTWDGESAHNESDHDDSSALSHHSWICAYAALLQYGAEHGHCNVPLKAQYRCVVTVPHTTNSDSLHPTPFSNIDSITSAPNNSDYNIMLQVARGESVTNLISLGCRFQKCTYDGKLGLWLQKQTLSAIKYSMSAKRLQLIQELFQQGISLLFDLLF